MEIIICALQSYRKNIFEKKKLINYKIHNNMLAKIVSYAVCS